MSPQKPGAPPFAFEGWDSTASSRSGLFSMSRPGTNVGASVPAPKQPVWKVPSKYVRYLAPETPLFYDSE
jgi:hypothetical protein